MGVVEICSSCGSTYHQGVFLLHLSRYGLTDRPCCSSLWLPLISDLLRLANPRDQLGLGQFADRNPLLKPNVSMAVAVGLLTVHNSQNMFPRAGLG